MPRLQPLGGIGRIEPVGEIRIVLDTNVIVSALLSNHGKPYEVWRKALTGDFAVCCSDGVIAEYLDVLSRPRLGIAGSDMADVLGLFEHHGIWLVPRKSSIPFIDEDDRVFYDTAKSGGALLVTGNKKHYPVDSDVLSPAAFLERTS